MSAPASGVRQSPPRRERGELLGLRRALRRSSLRRWASLLALSAFALAGCEDDSASGGSASSANPNAPVSEASIEALMLDAYCSGLATCCQQQTFPFDRGACEATLRPEIVEGLSEQRGGGRVYDAAAAGDCVAGARDFVASCGELPEPTACDRLYVGTVAVGGSCNPEASCVPGAFCMAGECVATPLGEDGRPPSAAEGDPCTATCDAVEDGFVCGGAAPAGGDPSAPRVQAACHRDAGLYCSSASVCERVANEGEPCNPSGFGSCASGLHCDASLATCAAPRPVGSPCSGGGSCERGAYCAEGRCRELAPGGSPCAGNVECRGYCDGTQCVDFDDAFVTREECAGGFD